MSHFAAMPDRFDLSKPAHESLLTSQSMAEHDALDPERRPEDFQPDDWSAIVSRIRSNDATAMEDLYAVFARGIRYFILRNLGPDELDDRVHDCFILVAEAIQNGELRDPARLMGYVRTVVKRYIATTIEVAVQQRRAQVDYEDNLFCLSDWKEDPERAVMSRQRAEIAQKVMQGISNRDREILHRFYVDEQPPEQICDEMGLSFNQFRLLKSRAKKRFGTLGQRVAKGLGRKI